MKKLKQFLRSGLQKVHSLFNKNEKQPAAMTAPNTHITEYLKYYCQLEQAPEYAVLLKGKWGSGKTWFIHQFLSKLEEEKQVKHLYVSLYGMTSFSEIEDEFFKQLHPNLSSKSMQLAGKIAKGLLKTTIKVDLDDDGKADGSVSSQIPTIELPDYLTDTSKYIIVFDDLERASIDLKSLLGYINHFVEHQGYKVILIANEEELLEQQRGEDQLQGFTRIKEKLVGKTFEVETDFHGALQYFISTLTCDKTKTALQKHQASIREIYFKAEYFNLRHLKQALWDFERLLLNIEEKFIKEEELISDLIKIFLIISFEIKSGNLKTNNIKGLFEGRFEYLMDIASGKTNSKERSSTKYYEQYITDDSLGSLLSKEVWLEIFDKGILPREKVNASLASSKYFISENTPDWKKLWHYMDLNDEEFKYSLTNVKEAMQNEAITNIFVIKHLHGIFQDFAKSKIIPETQEEVFNKFCSYVDTLRKTNQLNTDLKRFNSFFFEESYDGLGFFDRDTEHSKNFNEYIKNAHEQAYEDELPKKGKALLELMVKDSQKFYQDVVSTHHGESHYHDKSIFDQIDQDEFVHAFSDMNPKMRRKAALAFSSRYQDNHYITNLLPELKWLEGVKTKLEEKAKALMSENKITGFQIKRQTDKYFTLVIQALNEAKKDKNSPSE